MEAAGSVIKEGEPQLQTGEPLLPTANEVHTAKQEWPGLCPDKGGYSWETAEHNDWGQIFLLFSVVIMYYSTFLNWNTHTGGVLNLRTKKAMDIFLPVLIWLPDASGWMLQNWAMVTSFW